MNDAFTQSVNPPVHKILLQFSVFVFLAFFSGHFDRRFQVQHAAKMLGAPRMSRRIRARLWGRWNRPL